MAKTTKTDYTMRGLEPEFWRQVRVQAALQGLTVKAYIVKVLREALYGAAK